MTIHGNQEINKLGRAWHGHALGMLGMDIGSSTLGLSPSVEDMVPL
jgi:hypothetical protein